MNIEIDQLHIALPAGFEARADRIARLVGQALAHLPGTIEHGDLALREEGEGGRVLPTAIFARWSRD